MSIKASSKSPTERLRLDQVVNVLVNILLVGIFIRLPIICGQLLHISNPIFQGRAAYVLINWTVFVLVCGGLGYLLSSLDLEREPPREKLNTLLRFLFYKPLHPLWVAIVGYVVANNATAVMYEGEAYRAVVSFAAGALASIALPMGSSWLASRSLLPAPAQKSRLLPRRFWETLLNDLSLVSYQLAWIALAVYVAFGTGLGTVLTAWLSASAVDAGISSEPPDTIGTLPLVIPQVVRQLVPDGWLPTFDFGVKSVLAIAIVMLLRQASFRAAVFLTDFQRRWFRKMQLQTIGETATSSFRSVLASFEIVEKRVWFKNAAAAFWWLVGSYLLLFSIIALLPSTLGTAIAHWLDASLSDAGFGQLSVTTSLHLRLFLASIIAMFGAAPLAATLCVFLPSKKKELLEIHENFLVAPPHLLAGPLARRVRMFCDLKSVSLKGARNKPWNQQSLQLSYFTGGALTISLKDMAAADVIRLLGFMDEFADNCTLPADVISLLEQLSVESEAMKPAVNSHAGSDSEKHNRRYQSTIFSALHSGQELNQGTIRVVRKLASRPMSAVYLVRYNGALAVLKQFVVPEHHPDAARLKQQFLREFQLLENLNNNRISKVLSVFEENESSFLLLEHARGQELRSMIEQFGARQESQVLDWAIQLAGIMLYLHSQSPPVVHRDITPDNLVVDDQDYLRLIDFGAAHQFIEGVTGTLIGKQSFVAPEQLRGKPTVRSDIYSFGGTLHFLLTGKDPKPLSPCRPAQDASVSKALSNLIARCTEFDEADRPQSFEEVWLELRNLAGTAGKHSCKLVAETDALLANLRNRPEDAFIERLSNIGGESASLATDDAMCDAAVTGKGDGAQVSLSADIQESVHGQSIIGSVEDQGSSRGYADTRQDAVVETTTKQDADLISNTVNIVSGDEGVHNDGSETTGVVLILREPEVVTERVKQ